MIRAVTPLAIAAMTLLAACGGDVAATAPRLMPDTQVQGQLTQTQDTTRGARVASELAWRGAGLRARAATLLRRPLDGG